ncbi:MAG: hypothetical protein QGF09_08630, partial [Rhodospirillales bacterium]|nr:hypothetical protein [Rhodospirillales bacterium]
FCLKFDCFGAGQAVSRLFRDLASDWQGEESIERFKFDVFVLLYTQISNHLFPGRQLEMEADPESAEKLKPFLEAAVNLLGQDS